MLNEDNDSLEVDIANKNYKKKQMTLFLLKKHKKFFIENNRMMLCKKRNQTIESLKKYYQSLRMMITPYKIDIYDLKDKMNQN